MNKYMIFLTAAVFLSVSGCSIDLDKPEPLTPLKYYRYPAYDLKRVGSVVMLEMNNNSENRQISSELTTALAEEIRKQQVFGLKTIDLVDPQWKSLEIPEGQDFSKIQLAMIRTRLKADAIMYGTVTHYRPYPRNLIGLKLELRDCSTGRRLWAVDDVWDITNAMIQRRAKAFYENQMTDSYGPLKSEIVTLSPRIYNKFIASEIAQTLE